MCKRRFVGLRLSSPVLGLVAGPGQANCWFTNRSIPPGGSVDGLNGGSGFAGPWEDDDATLRIEPGSLLMAWATRWSGQRTTAWYT